MNYFFALKVHSMYRRIVLIVLTLCSFPVYSATPTFSFAEFNIAFVLGLSLPTILISLLITSYIKLPSVNASNVEQGVVKKQWLLPLLMTVALLAFLYSITLFDENKIALLSSGVLFIALATLWPMINSSLVNDEKSKNKTLQIGAMLIYVITGCYLVFLWLLSPIAARIEQLVWLIVNILILSIGLLHLVLLVNKGMKHLVYRMILPWVLSTIFVLTLFTWLKAELAITWIIGAGVLSYLTTLLNGHWCFLQGILNVEHLDKHSENISSDELFSYTHDLATNLPTQQQAIKYFQHQIQQDERKKLVAIVFKPVNFNQVNSVLGHHNSDLLLLQLAYCLQKKVADNTDLLHFDIDIENIRIARLHSLHFLVVMDLTHHKHDSKSIIDDLCRQLSQAVPEAMSFKSFSLNFKLAFGVAITNEHGNSAAEVVAHATDALLLAETHQQMTYYYNAETALYTEHQLLSMERLKQDIADDNLYWYLQPQVNVTNKEITGFELKTRWLDDKDKSLELDEFIEIAEYSGDVYALTKIMIIKACQVLQQLSSLQKTQPVSINLSSQYLLESDLVDFIEQQTQKYNVSPKQLIIELTEPIMLLASTSTKSIIDQLRYLDIRIAIDNFSGSYESLRYLRKMAINQVKINCTLLNDNEESRPEKAIVNALINLSRTMKLPLVGIGVDNEMIENIFLAMGGDVIQGNRIRREIKIDELDHWLKGWNKEAI